MRRPLYLSFTNLMAALASGRVSDDDLVSGLFAFGCTRERALHPGKDGGYVDVDVRKYPYVHDRLRRALIRAEEEGRVAWAERPAYMSYHLISDLFERWGYARIDRPEDRDRDYYRSVVAERVVEAGIDILVYTY